MPNTPVNDPTGNPNGPPQNQPQPADKLAKPQKGKPKPVTDEQVKDYRKEQGR